MTIADWFGSFSLLGQSVRALLVFACSVLVVASAASEAGPNLPPSVDLGIPSYSAGQPAWLKGWSTFGRLHGETGQVSYCNGTQIFVGPLIRTPTPTAATLTRTLDPAFEAIAFIDNVSGAGSDTIVRSDYVWVQDYKNLDGSTNPNQCILRILRARPADLTPDFANPVLVLTFARGANGSEWNGTDGTDGTLLNGRGPIIPAIVGDFNNDQKNDLIVWNPGQDSDGALQYHPAQALGVFTTSPEVIFKTSPMSRVRVGVAQVRATGGPSLILGDVGFFYLGDEYGYGLWQERGVKLFHGGTGTGGHTFAEVADVGTGRNVPVPTTWFNAAPSDRFEVTSGNVNGGAGKTIAMNGVANNAYNYWSYDANTVIVLNVGTASESWFGPSAASSIRIVGDVDGDSYDDLVFSHEPNDYAGTSSGGLWRGSAAFNPSSLNDFPDRNDGEGRFQLTDLTDPWNTKWITTFTYAPSGIAEPLLPTFAAKRLILVDTRTTTSTTNLRAVGPLVPVPVLTGPTITTQPVAATVNVGQTATFTVTATGTAPLTYQWQANGNAIPGATDSTYTIPATIAADDGVAFSVVVTNAIGSRTSDAALLTVQVPPVITTQPQNATVAVGLAASFTVVATGATPLTYQWRRNGTDISGATAATYVLPAVAATDAGVNFSVVVTNRFGSLPSANAVLTVTYPPTIATQPQHLTVTAGQTATFSVWAGGGVPLHFQWYRNGVAIPGATSANYVTPAVTSTDSGARFHVVITNSFGTKTSAEAILTVIIAPAITTQPQAITVNAGQTATFSVAATGTAPLTYQWKRGGTAISGATAATYTTPVTTAADANAIYTVVVSNAAGSRTSANAVLGVNVAPTITVPPTALTVNAGQAATFTVTATGTAPLAYQWTRSGTAISGATAATYTIPATTGADAGVYAVVVTNLVGSAPSTGAALTVNLPPTITTQPQGVSVTAGQPATFTVAATGVAPITYQWKRNGSPISGATSASYTLANPTAADAGAVFTVVVGNAAGTTNSASATLQVSNGSGAPPPNLGPFRWARWLLNPANPTPTAMPMDPAVAENAYLISGDALQGRIAVMNWQGTNQAGTRSWGGNTFIAPVGSAWWIGPPQWDIFTGKRDAAGVITYARRNFQDWRLHVGYLARDGATLTSAHGATVEIGAGPQVANALVLELPMRWTPAAGWTCTWYRGNPPSAGVWKIPASQSVNTAQATLSNRLADLTSVLSTINPGNGTWAVDFRAGTNGAWTLAIDATGTGTAITTIRSQDAGRLPGFPDVTGQSGLLFSLEPAASNSVGQIGKTPVTLAYRQSQAATTVPQLALSPSSAAVAPGANLDLSASVTSGGAPIIPAPAITWTTTIGTIVATGATTARFTAPATAGTATVTASAPGVTAATAVLTIGNPPPSVTSVTVAAGTPVPGISTALDVVATDAAGESALTYTWSATGPASVAFSASASNAAKHTTATFLAAGSYTVTLVVTNSLGLQTTVPTTVLVAATPTLVSLTPTTASVAVGATIPFSASVSDQFGSAIQPPPAISWTATGGTITTNGTFTAGAPGNASVQAATATRTATASVTILGNSAPTIVSAAAADPNPVTGPSTVLTVLGADDGGEAALSYAWIATGPAAVTITPNTGNAAKRATATFTQAGTYQFTATITDAGGLTATTTLPVTVVATPTILRISPTAVVLAPNATATFTQSLTDQFGQPISAGLAPEWRLDAGTGVSDPLARTLTLTAPTAAPAPFQVQVAISALNLSAEATVTISRTVTRPDTPLLLAPAFDVVQWSSSPTYAATYLGSTDPARVWQALPAASGTPVLRLTSPSLVQVGAGLNATITVIGPAGIPVNGTITAEGRFDTGKNATTQVIPAGGTLTLTVIAPPRGQTAVLISSPLAAGLHRVLVKVQP